MTGRQLHIGSVSALACFGLVLRLWCLWTARMMADDAYIVMRVARNLGHGLGFVYNLGSHEQVSTSILWTTVAGVSWRLLGTSTPFFLQILGAILDAAVVAVVGLGVSHQSETLDSPADRLGGILAASLYAFGSTAVLISTSGLETPLYVLAVVLCLSAISRGRWTLAALYSVLGFAVRPDGALLVCVVLFAALLEQRRIPWRAAVVASAGVAAVAATTELLFGSVIPQTAVAKHLLERDALGGLSSVLAPLFYGSAAAVVFGGLALTGLIRALLQRRWALLAVYGWCAAFVFAISFGATWWPWYKPPVFAAYAIMVALGFSTIAGLAQRGLDGRLIAVTSTALVLGTSTALMLDVRRKTVPYSNGRAAMEGQRRDIARIIEASTTGDATVMLEPLGVVGFYCDRTFLDYPGLAARTVTDTLKQLGRPIPGKPIDPVVMDHLLRGVRPTVLVLRHDEMEAIGGVANAAGYRLLGIVPADPSVTAKYPDFQDMSILVDRFSTSAVDQFRGAGPPLRRDGQS